MFSQHCVTPFAVEPVDVVDALGNTTATPVLANRDLSVNMEYVKRCTGAQSTPGMAVPMKRLVWPG
jgi:phenylalanyl-tRNA synthetase beta chain